MLTVADVRRITSALPRSYEVVVRDQIKFRVGRIVYVAFSRDETVMGVAFPKEERAAMVAAEPDKFMLPRKSDMRFNWILVRLDAIDIEELRELVIDAWRMCVPKKIAAFCSLRWPRTCAQQSWWTKPRESLFQALTRHVTL